MLRTPFGGHPWGTGNCPGLKLGFTPPCHLVGLSGFKSAFFSALFRWLSVSRKVRERFKEALATSPASSLGVAAILDTWAREAESVVKAEVLPGGVDQVAAPELIALES